jgi:transposase
MTETGKILRLLTNDLTSPASEIAGLYKRRWAIELFFRWVKQTLKIKRFLGTSENAVRIQITAALIAFLLLRAARQALGVAVGPLAFATLIKANVMHRGSIRGVLGLADEPRQSRNDRQEGFRWA